MTDITIYGIPNCDTVRKARKWLDSQGAEYIFHDFRKDGVDPAKVDDWIGVHGIDTVLNRRGTTWRKLSGEEQADARDRHTAVTLLVQHPSMIKRPVIERNGSSLVGFKEDEWSAFLS